MTDRKTANTPPHNSEQSSTFTDDSLIVSESDILSGDILLYRSQSPSKAGSKISAATNSPYTHAAISLGHGEIADSNFPFGVKKGQLSASLQGTLCVGVLRTQCVFSKDREEDLHVFVDAVIKNGKFYDLRKVLEFESESEKYFANQIEFIRNNYGKVTSTEDFTKSSYFCSSFVVACWSVVGIIGVSAQTAYPPEFFSPAGLYRDPTFGWLLGYLVPEGGCVPDDNPLERETTLWRDQQ